MCTRETERDLKHIRTDPSLFNRQSQATCLAQGHNVMIYERRDGIRNVSPGCEGSRGPREGY